MTDSARPAAIDAVAGSAFMVPLLPCGDVDDMADFWTGLGLQVTYRQRRPNAFVALELGGIALQYYGMPEWDPEQSHSSCVVAVTDTEPLYELFSAGLRERFGKLPLTGFPRVTRPRSRANNGGLSGFSLIDPVTSDGDVTTWTGTPGAGPVTRALDAAVVQADSHGDPVQARKILEGALRRASGAGGPSLPVAEVAPALAYLVELCVRTGDEEAARSAHTRLAELAAADLTPSDRNIADVALTEARAVLPTS